MGGNYTTVFDATAQGWRTWPGAAFGMIFVALGLAMLFRPQIFGQPPPKGMAWFFLVFSAFWTTTVAFGTWHEYSAVKEAAATGALKVAEGKVEHFVPMPYTGHATESFCVKDACFAYSDYLVTTGFNNTSSHGGPVREGLKVRVTYMENSDAPRKWNIIVKLEVAP